MDHIFDNVGVDAREALKLVVPISASAGVFPVASGQKGGLRLDDTLGNMFYSDGTNWRQVGSVLSVGLSASGALAVSGSPVTTSGVINLNWTGTSGQYVRGDGVLQAFPTIPSVAGKYVALSDADAGYSGQLSAVNLNDYTKTQVIYSNGDVTNNPTANSYVVWIGSAANTYGAQMAINPSVSDKFFFRNNYNTSWSSWYQVASREWVISQNYLTSGSGNAVWKIQGGSTDATTNTQNIYHNANVWLGDGSGSSSSYRLHVSGISYFTGYVTINNIPTAASATDILVSNGGVVSTRTVASLGIPVITPSALTKTDDTNVTLTLGGTPGTALLQNVSLTLGWNGVLAISRGGTGLGTLGTANQLLRVNSSATALEYFTPDWTTNTGTVTSVGLSASGALSVTGSPVTGSGVMTLNWTGTTSQYVRGDGSLNTFPTIPVVQWSDSLVAYGRTSVGGLTYSTGLKYDYTNSAFSVGTRAAGSVGTGSVQLGGNSVISGGYAIGLGYQNTVSGNYSTASGYNHTVLANYCFVSGNANTQTNSSGVGSFLSGREISHGTGAYLFASGYLLTVSGHYSFTVGTENTNSGTYSAIIGRNGTVTHSGNVMLLDSGSGTNITSGTSNQFTARFYNGYRFMTTNTVRAMDISSSRVITIDNLAGSGTRMVVANSSGELSTQTIPSGANSVWYIQGTATDATTNTQNIYHNANVMIGSSGTSTYMLSVVGNAYIMNGVEINNNQSYKGFNTSATAVNLIKINSSNYIEIGQSSYDIYLPNYTSSRSADTVSTSDKYLYVNSSGYLKADSAQWMRNDGGGAYITSSESHAADSTNRKVTFDTVLIPNNSYYSQGGSSGDYRINFPSGYTYHFVVVTLEYTTSGTPTVTAQLRMVNTAVETNISTSADGRKVMTIHTMMSASSSSDYPTLYLSVSGSAITLQKCRMTVIPMGAVPP